ncbi:putative putrescine importer, partial [Serratia symbiotica str. Tucson]
MLLLLLIQLLLLV